MYQTQRMTGNKDIRTASALALSVIRSGGYSQCLKDRVHELAYIQTAEAVNDMLSYCNCLESEYQREAVRSLIDAVLPAVNRAELLQMLEERMRWADPEENGLRTQLIRHTAEQCGK